MDRRARWSRDGVDQQPDDPVAAPMSPDEYEAGLYGDQEPRVEPHTSREAEREVLAAAFNSPVAFKRLRGIVAREDFHWPHHQAIWDGMLRFEAFEKTASAGALGVALAGDRMAVELLPELVSLIVSGYQATTAAEVVHNLASRRRLIGELQLQLSLATNPLTDSEGLAAKIVTRFTELRDTGATSRTVPITVTELISVEDEPYDWIIPGLLERGDRFMLTGEEGLGKSVLLRQLAMCVAAGIHPFIPRETLDNVGTALIIDAENSTRQNRRAFRRLDDQMRGKGQRNASDHVRIEMTGRIDITKDLVLSQVHRWIDEVEPDVLVIGPMYRLVPGAVQTDDEAAPLLAALDTIKDRGIAMLIEAHAGHARATGPMRPRGSSAFLGWPEFGYGLRASTDTEGLYLLERWRGDRDERSWPHSLEHHHDLPWTASETQKLEWADKERRMGALTPGERQLNPWMAQYTP
jgi:replicative DNA helicase